MNAAVQANSTLDVPSGVHDESTEGQAAQLSTSGLMVASTKTRTTDLLQVPRLNEWSRWAGEPPRSDSSQLSVESRAEDVASVAASMKDGIRVNQGEQFPAMSLSYTVSLRRTTEGYSIKRCVDGFIELFVSKERVSPMHLVALNTDRTEWRPIPSVLVTDPEGFIEAAKVSDESPVARWTVPLILVHDPDGFVTKADTPDGEPVHKACTKVEPEDPAEGMKVHNADHAAAAVPMQERGRERERDVVSQRRPRGARSGKNVRVRRVERHSVSNAAIQVKDEESLPVRKRQIRMFRPTRARRSL